MIEIAIVEDEQEYRDQLCDYLNKYKVENNEEIHVTTFTDGDEIVENYNGQFDIMLMDIEMEFMDGMTTAKRIRERDSEVIIVFITNMAQYAIQGYTVDALDYVLKPVSYFAFSQRLGRAITRMKKRETKFLNIVSKTGVNKVAVSEIKWIESEGHRLTYHTKQGNYESTINSMKEIENALENCNFFRCNNCYLVNLAHVKGIKESYAILIDAKISISRAKKGEFQKALTNYMGETVK